MVKYPKGDESMKKMILGLSTLLFLMGCQSKEPTQKPSTPTVEEPTIEVLDNKKTYTIKDKIKFEIIKTAVVDEIAPTNKNQTYKYIKAKDKHTFIDLILKVENLTDQEMDITDIVSGKFRIAKQTFNLKHAIETMNYNQISQTDTLKDKETRYIHAYSEVSKDIIKKEATAHLEFLDEKEYDYIFSTEEETKNNLIKSVGDTIKLDQSTITLLKHEQNKKIEPSKKGFFYSYIKPDNDNETYVYLQVDIKNVSDRVIEPDEYIYCEYIVADKKIKSEIIIESDNHQSIAKSGDISALATRTVYLAMPVSDDLLNQEASIQLFVEGNTFDIQE